MDKLKLHTFWTLGFVSAFALPGFVATGGILGFGDWNFPQSIGWQALCQRGRLARQKRKLAQVQEVSISLVNRWGGGKK